MAAKRISGGKSSPQSGRTSSRKVQKKKGISYGFHIGLKEMFGGATLLSLLAAFEVFSIPAANGIIDLFSLTEGLAGWTWVGVSLLSGGTALYLHEEEKDK